LSPVYSGLIAGFRVNPQVNLAPLAPSFFYLPFAFARHPDAGGFPIVTARCSEPRALRTARYFFQLIVCWNRYCRLTYAVNGASPRLRAVGADLPNEAALMTPSFCGKLAFYNLISIRIHPMRCDVSQNRLDHGTVEQYRRRETGAVAASIPVLYPYTWTA
jgi:hypothetical protein